MKLRLISICVLLLFLLQNVVMVNAQDTVFTQVDQQAKTLKDSQYEKQLNEQQSIDSKGIQEKLLKDKQPNARKNILVKYKKGAQKNFRKSLEASSAQTQKRNIKKLFGEEVESMELDEVEVKTLKQDSEVEFVEEDATVQESGKITPASTDKLPWNVSYVNADLVQEKGYSGKGINVAIFDTGIDTNNTDLKIDGGISFVDGISSYSDDNGHGTAMASILSSIKNNSGLIGVAPKINLYSVKVLDSFGSGSYSNIIKGIEWAIDNKIDIISMSFGGTQYSKILEDAICEASSNNILIIAAAGNEGSNSIDFPAKYAKVVCVGAVDKAGKVAPFSNRGAEMDLAAPGVGIETTTIGNKAAIINGTSPAVPHVAGVAAQILSAKKKLTIDELKAILYKSTTPVPNMEKESYGWGIVNAYNSLENINAGLKLDENDVSDVKFVGQDDGTDGNVHMSYIIYGDNISINAGQTAEVRGGFNSSHTQLEITVENASGTRLYPIVYRSPIAANAYVTYTTPTLSSAGQYIVRYHCTDNVGSTFDDLFHITVTAATPTPTPATTATPTPATTPTPTPTASGDDYGNSFSAAYNMTVSAGRTTSRSVTLEVANDVDFLKFTAPATGNYTIYSSNNSVDPMGWLYNSSQTELASNDDSNGVNFSISYTLTQGQVYYLKVSHYSQNGTGTFLLNITAPAAPADDYGNNSSSAYNLGTLSQTLTTKNGSIEVAYDLDFFKFTAPVSGTYTIKTTGSTDTMGQLYSSGTAAIGSEIDDVGDANFVITASLTANSSYYIRVRGYTTSSGSSSVTGQYILNITKPDLGTVNLGLGTNGEEYLDDLVAESGATRNGNTVTLNGISKTYDSSNSRTLNGKLVVNAYDFVWNFTSSLTINNRILALNSDGSGGGVVVATLPEGENTVSAMSTGSIKKAAYQTEGENVRNIQKVLQRAWYWVNPTANATGYFGATTKTSLIKFQKEYMHLTDNDIYYTNGEYVGCGQKTADALSALYDQYFGTIGIGEQAVINAKNNLDVLGYNQNYNYRNENGQIDGYWNDGFNKALWKFIDDYEYRTLYANANNDKPTLYEWIHQAAAVAGDDEVDVSMGTKTVNWLSYAAPSQLYNAGDVVYSNAVQNQLITETNNYYDFTDPQLKANILVFLNNIRAAYNDDGYLHWEDSWYKAVEGNQEPITFVMMTIDLPMGAAAEFRGIVKAEAEIAGVAGVVKWVGELTGAVKEIETTEWPVVNEWLEQGRTVVKIAKDPNAIVPSYDFIVDGVKIETKALTNPNVNTGITRVQDAFAQGAETAVIDCRKAGLTVEQAQEIIRRAAGTYANKALPGNVEIWTNEGIVFTK